MNGEHAPAAHAAPLSDCPNCGGSLRDLVPAADYCPRCGQETVLHPPSVAEFAHEFVGHYIALEGPLWRTLRLLVLHPGRLTVEYLRGRRRLYVLPLRLYLSASFVFFLALKLTAAGNVGRHDEGARGAAAGASAAAMQAASAPRRPALQFGVAGERVQVGAAPDEETQRILREQRAACDAAARGASGVSCNWMARTSTRASQRWIDDPQAAQAEFIAHALGVAPYAVFLMLPIYAGIVALAYRGRRRMFGEHLVFGMHLHAFWFLAGTLALLLPDGAWGVVALLAAGHALRALPRVYGGGWPGAIARGAAVSLVYGALLSLVSVALSFWLFIQ